MFRFVTHSWCFVLAVALAGACNTPDPDARRSVTATGSDGQQALLDVNDVTVLFPFRADSGTMTPDLPLDSFISKEVFDQVVAATKTTQIFSGAASAPPGTDEVEGYESWRVVSFRFDPCAPSTSFVAGVPAPLSSVLPGCLVELRLVAQPLTVRPFGASRTSDSPRGVRAPQDFAIHLIYDLGVVATSSDTATLQERFAPFLPLVDGLRDIKAASAAAGADTNGALLGVHPGLEISADIGARMAAYLRTALRPERLNRVAFMGIPLDGPLPWQFIAGSIAPDTGRFVQGPLPGFASPLLVENFRGIFAAGGGAFPDLPSGPLSVAKLSNDFPEMDPTGNPLPRRNAIAGAFSIEDPSVAHALNMDCVSCHAAHVFHAPPRGSFLHADTAGVHSRSAIESLEDLSPSRFVPPAGVTGYIASEAFDASGWHVHNLGYFGMHPRIAERTLNETAAVVDLTNRLLAGDGHVNPGLRCGSDRAALDAIYLCQLKAGSESERQACFAACQR